MPEDKKEDEIDVLNRYIKEFQKDRPFKQSFSKSEINEWLAEAHAYIMNRWGMDNRKGLPKTDIQGYLTSQFLKPQEKEKEPEQTPQQAIAGMVSEAITQKELKQSAPTTETIELARQLMGPYRDDVKKLSVEAVQQRLAIMRKLLEVFDKHYHSIVVKEKIANLDPQTAQDMAVQHISNYISTMLRRTETTEEEQLKMENTTLRERNNRLNDIVNRAEGILMPLKSIMDSFVIYFGYEENLPEVSKQFQAYSNIISNVLDSIRENRYRQQLEEDSIHGVEKAKYELKIRELELKNKKLEAKLLDMEKEKGGNLDE